MHRRTWCLTLSILLCVIGLISSYAQAGQVQLSWDAPTTNTDGLPITGLTGYKVYYSQAGGNFASSVNVGKVTTYTLSGLQDGKTYFFVATAYNTAGQKSGFSNEGSTTLPLPVSINSFTLTPASMVLGASATLAWTTTGATSVSITPGGSANLPINGSLTVSPSATTTYNLTATGASGTVTKQVTVTVTAPPPPEEASSGQYVWVPEENGTILDPSANDNFVRYTFTAPKADTYIIWGRVSPSATGTGSFFMAMNDALAEGGESEPGTITDVVPTTYQVAPLQVGDRYYIDRTFTIKALPAALAGQPAIKTANSDKGNTSATYLSFTVTQNATLYVAYDSRATRFPTC